MSDYKTVREINLDSVDLESVMEGFTTNESKVTIDLLLINAEIMLVDNENKKFMGNISAQNLVTKDWFYSYWLELPEETFDAIEYYRKQFYDVVSTNSKVDIMLSMEVKSTGEQTFEMTFVIRRAF